MMTRRRPQAMAIADLVQGRGGILRVGENRLFLLLSLEMVCDLDACVGVEIDGVPVGS